MDKLNIPKTIKVGYQERGNTYTGKLAYIIYIDDKAKTENAIKDITKELDLD